MPHPRGTGLLLLLPPLLLLAACTAVIQPPPSPREPATVYLLDHGRHTSLVLPAPGGAERYAFGDWRWYALGDTGVSQGLAALLGPTRGALGRYRLEGTDPAAALSGLAVGVQEAFAIQVERADASALREQLERRHGAAAERVWNASAQLEFAPVGHYSLGNNSNTSAADWLRALGCEVSGPALFARWRVEQR